VKRVSIHSAHTVLLFALIMLTACNFGGAAAPTPAAGDPTSSGPTSGPTSAPPTNAPTVVNVVPSITPAPGATSGPAISGTGIPEGCTAGTGRVVTLASELKYEDLVICDAGIEAKPGMSLQVHYLGTFRDGGAKFDSSYDRGQPIGFVLGSGQVIAGWDQGLVGMKVGGKRRLIIPPALAYGASGRPGIPGNSTLVFEVTLVAAK
jgi:hypothetical protein